MICWLGHVLKMGEEQNPKVCCLASWSIAKMLNIRTDEWKLLANDRIKRQSTIQKRTKRKEKTIL